MSDINKEELEANRNYVKIVRENNERSHQLREKWNAKIPGRFEHPSISRVLQQTRAGFPLVSPEEKIAVFGAGGQIGTKLRPLLEKLYPGQVIYCDSKGTPEETKAAGFTPLDVMDTQKVGDFIKDNNVKVVIHLAALLSSVAEEKPNLALRLNVETPINLILHAKEWGLRKLQIMSSIAAHESAPHPYDSEATRIARQEAGKNASPSLVSSPRSPYGQAKRILEDTAELYSTHYGLDVQTPRLAGVLNCHRPWPSDGTTEELDKMIIAAAYHKVYGDNIPPVEKKKGEPKEPILERGVYYPQVPGEATFNMVDGDTLPLAIVTMLHKDLRGRDATHNIAEYSISMKDAGVILHKLNPTFKFAFDADHYNAGKIARADMWPQKSDVTSTEAIIGSFGKPKDGQSLAEQSIVKQYDEAVRELTRQRDGVKEAAPQLTR